MLLIRSFCHADGWANMRRNGSQPIQANVTRFPNGIKEVADYVHAKGALSCRSRLVLLPLPCHLHGALLGVDSCVQL